MSKKDNDNFCKVLELLRIHRMGMQPWLLEKQFGWEIRLVKFGFEGRVFPFFSPDRRIPEVEVLEEYIEEFEIAIGKILMEEQCLNIP